ncbi:MAG: deoxyribose-phosphate aldolase [Xanthomonadales bacterium]|nr:deoxyribose-phosphate aldolase [Gammaproteobacteria bacterium]MBT8053232.1 deoxyribose-phosphate aldolase [Gammaproteobacteria bacterium]NND56824.1 deoxyribose-phosphate aldolase [Xanthomonadales bacterium]NNK50272.1 deoxyribose-phosphate aldolase [Xanthomonadales bacterium]
MTAPSKTNVHSIADRGGHDKRNPGMEFDPDLFGKIRINRSAVERRAATIGTRRTVKKTWQAAWLLRAVTCIDLTTLAGDDTPGRVRRLCQKAMRPVRADILDALGVADLGITTAAVCVYHNLIETAVDELKGSGIPVAAVSTGFPAGQIPLKLKLAQISESVSAGATEIDIVISRGRVLTGDWKGLFDEVKSFRKACGDAHLKTILATGELGTLSNVAKASWVCMMAGADFIKTSTGKESVNATLPYSLVMVRAIRDFQELTGYRIGYKPAGGISKAKDALNYLFLIKEELGKQWIDPALFRFGASSLLGDIERQLEHHVTGSYSAQHRHPAG